MTDRHECEWAPWHPWCSTYRCIYPGCYKNMPSEEIANRLNEYETLKKATEALSAEDARSLLSMWNRNIASNFAGWDKEAMNLGDYANILDGK